MEITEVRIKLTDDSDDRLQAFCSITFDDCFVVRDLKVIEGTNGPFVAMPSRKLTSHCPRCGTKNHLRASFCNQCGIRLNPDRAPRDFEGRAKLYADIAHPINSTCREVIQDRVISAYRQEVELAKQPGYVSRYDEDYEDEFSSGDFTEPGAPQGTPVQQPGGTAAPPASAEVIQRTDPQPPSGGLRPPHAAGPAAEHRETHGTPQDTAQRKPGFGAGILDE